MTSKHIVTAALLGAALLGATSQARASVIKAEVFDNGTQVGSIFSSSNGVLQFTTTDSSFNSIQLTSDGVGVLPSPDLATQTTKVSSNTLTGTHDLQIIVTQTGLTGFNGLLDFATSYAANFLIGAGGIISDTISNYIDGGNGAFAETTLIGQSSCVAQAGAGGSCTAAPDKTISVSGKFSETQVFDAVFGPVSGGSALQSNSQIQGTVVPEPASLALLGGGLLALCGLARRPRFLRG